MVLEEIVHYINQADDIEINQIIDALTQRYKQVYPGWEVAFLAMPLDDPARRQAILELAMRCI